MPKLFYGTLPKDLSAVTVIMAGGSGTRFWPLSRTSMPKQFLPLTGSEQSLIQATAARLEPISGPHGTLVVTAEHQAALVREQLPNAAVLAEPTQRNTAACVGYAAQRILADVGDVPMLCVPADHMIRGESALCEIFRSAVDLVRTEDALVTIGIQPTAPETGYGYIRRGDALPGKAGAYSVRQFVEKPDRQTAEHYLDSGEYFWNSGMFVWRPSSVLAEIERLLPELRSGLARIEQIWTTAGDTSRYNRIADVYQSLQSISIDFGVMEKAKNVVMFSGTGFEWNDVGSWSSWVDVAAGGLKDDGNFTEGDVVLVDSERCAVLGSKSSRNRKCIAGVGLSDLVIVETEDAILICNRNQTQEVKKVVEALKNRNRQELL
ncbi:MAG: mannose-1-phosphate guanylyltransferase [Bdellovibrionota bacterium]